MNYVILTEVHVELTASLLQLFGFMQHTEALLLDALLRQHRIGADVERLAQLMNN